MTTPTPYHAGPATAKRGAFDRFFRIDAASSARQALVNLLARTPLSRTTPDVVSQVLEEHRVTGAGGRELLKGLWRDAVLEFLKDDRLTDEEMAYLAELRRVLTLSTTESEALLDDAVSARYGRGLTEVLADGTVTPEDQGRLDRLAASLRLDADTRARLNKLHVEEFAETQAKVISADKRVSLEELQAIDQLGAALGVAIQLDSATTATLARYHHLWLIENGQPPTFPVDIALHEGEAAYYSTAARWAEMRIKTVAAQSDGPTASMRITKGVRWRVGTTPPNRVTEEQLTVVDSGVLYVTSRRVVFRGGMKNVTLELGSLVGIHVYRDGIQFEKAEGRSPYALFDTDVELAAVLLTSLLAGT
jgi:hypothetical protein